MGHLSKNKINKIKMNSSIKEISNYLFDIKKASLIIIILPYIGYKQRRFNKIPSKQSLGFLNKPVQPL